MVSFDIRMRVYWGLLRFNLANLESLPYSYASWTQGKGVRVIFWDNGPMQGHYRGVEEKLNFGMTLGFDTYPGLNVYENLAKHLS